MNKKIVNIIGSLVIFIILASSFIKSVQSVKRGRDLVTKTEENLVKIKEETSLLEAQLDIVKSDYYVEKQLRDKLGLAREGETILVLPDEDTVKNFAPKIPTPEIFKPKPNWQKWLDLLKDSRKPTN